MGFPCRDDLLHPSQHVQQRLDPWQNGFASHWANSTRPWAIWQATRPLRARRGKTAACAEGPALGIGAPLAEDGALYNAYFILKGGKITSRVLKHELPNETVFDEVRIFDSGPLGGPYSVGNTRIGSPICEDAWHPDVAETLAETGAEFLLVPKVAHVDLERGPDGWRVLPQPLTPQPDEWESDYRVCVQGLRDYMRKTGFKKVLLGMSGGIDSAIVATIATDALGPENVRCVMLPSEYTSQASLEDAETCAKALGVRYDYVPIREGRQAITNTLAPLFEGTEEGLTEENIQSRLRGLLLMALSNKFGEMLLTTGNKSEVAVGYATIYGDMSGGYNPIKDMYKTRVFETCRWRNANHRDWMMGPARQPARLSRAGRDPEHSGGSGRLHRRLRGRRVRPRHRQEGGAFDLYL